jgi:UDP-N-acetylmuramoyl-L-alanyl-D-glutamate--2,6-diaminopimelate ligase
MNPLPPASSERQTQAMKLEEIIRHTPCQAVRGPVDRTITGLAYDSRQVRPGYLFVAVPGEHHDGLAFAADAIQRGAVAVASQHPGFNSRDVTLVVVTDARRALAELAVAFYHQPSVRLQVAGVTGTNGKTTVTFLVKSILAAAGRTPGLLGTVQYEVGARVIPAGRTTPESLEIQALFDQMLHTGCRSVVMEVSSHALAQDRVRGIDFDAAVFTNLTQDHLDYHQTMERYFEAKKRLFLSLGAGAKRAVAIINTDDPWGRVLAASSDIKADIITFGRDAPALVRATDIQMGPSGSAFRVLSPWGEAQLKLSLLGYFNVMNALAAFAIGRALGVEATVAASALAQVRSVPGRLEEITTRRDWRVFVDYAHTDDALSHALQTLRTLTARRLLVVFGCGGSRDQAKRPLMGAVAARLADYAILTSDNPRKEDPHAIMEQIRAGFGTGSNFAMVEDRTAAIRSALQMARSGDLVLIAGKGHETTQEFANTIIPFDDRQVVRNLLQQEHG